jgi:hypothetical protein
MMAAAALALAIGAQAEDNLGSGSLLLSRSFGFGRGDPRRGRYAGKGQFDVVPISHCIGGLATGSDAT